jgi:type I restriction enzyme S subunit
MGTGHTPSRSEPEYWKDCTIPWLTTTDVHRFRKDEIDQVDDTELHLSTEGLANSAAVLHPAGTVALSRTASPGFSIIMGSDMATSQDYATWTCGPRLLPEFLLWCLRAMRRDLLGRLATGSTHKTIYFPELMSIRVPLPSLEEQLDAVSRIRESVQQSRSAVALIAASVDLLQEFKRSLISAAVSGEFEVSSASGRGVPA